MQDTNVRELTFFDTLEQSADPGSEYFDAEKVDVRPQLRHLQCGFAHTAADFQDRRRIAAERAYKIQRRCRVWNTENRQQFVECAPLRVSETPAAQSEAANGQRRSIYRVHLLNERGASGVRRHPIFAGGNWKRVQAALIGAITPATGELGLAL